MVLCTKCFHNSTVRYRMCHVPSVPSTLRLVCDSCLFDVRLNVWVDSQTFQAIAATAVKNQAARQNAARQNAANYGFPYGKQRSQNVSPPQIKVRIWWDVSIAAYRISVPYHEAFIDFLKATVPAGKRAFDPSTKIWTFEESYLQLIETAAKAIWSPTEINIVTRAQTAQNLPATATASPLASMCEQFVRALPYEAAKKAYQIAAMQLHPDRGGSAEQMSLLNVSWSRLEKELYGK